MADGDDKPDEASKQKTPPQETWRCAKAWAGRTIAWSEHMDYASAATLFDWNGNPVMFADLTDF